MTDLHPDHLALLSLARRAIELKESPLWKTKIEEACDLHSAACDALWDELHRQVDVQDGKVPVLEDPSVKARKLAKRMRREIIAVCNNAVVEALDNMDFGD